VLLLVGRAGGVRPATSESASLPTDQLLSGGFAAGSCRSQPRALAQARRIEAMKQKVLERCCVPSISDAIWSTWTHDSR
jgi:hypothetical protein